MRSEPTCWISLDFAETPPKWDKIFQMNTRKRANPARWDSVFFNQFYFVLLGTFLLHNGIIYNGIIYATVYCKKYLIKQSFYSDITNFLIELRLYITYQSGIKIISARWASPPTIIFIIFWDILRFYQISLSQQVTWCAVITCKHVMHEIPLDIPPDWKILGNISTDRNSMEL